MDRLRSLSPLLNRDSMMRLLGSVAAALLLWAFVTTIGDPEESRVFRIGADSACRDRRCADGGIRPWHDRDPGHGP